MSRLFFFILILPILNGAKAQKYDYRIANACDKVADVRELITQYENIGLKVASSDAVDSAEQWLVNKYVSFGYEPYLDSFTVNGRWNTNVIAEKKGKDTTKWIIVGAHYDTKGRSPGANDNGSGVIATLEIARIIRSIGTDRSIRFINFGAEELGLIGSEHYVRNTLTNYDEVVLMLNIDQLGGTVGQDNSRITCERDEDENPIINNSASFAITDTLARMVILYSTQTPILDRAFSSDYEPFEDVGIVITGLYQAGRDRNNHTETDIVANMDTEATTQAIKSALAATLYFGRINTVASISTLAQPLLHISPNPAYDKIEIPDGSVGDVVTITNHTGSIVMQAKLSSTLSVDLASMSDGLYTVSIYSPQKDNIRRAKLIIAN